MHSCRTHTCGELRPEHAGGTARLSGWVHRKRDHGNLLFIDLRDHYGITQCVFAGGSAPFTAAAALKLESVITVTGTVVPRAPDAVNPKLATGQVELQVAELAVQSVAEPLPLQVASDAEYPEETRLRYRFLDLRRETLHRNIMLRSHVIASIRRRMIAAGFTEFQTPILTSSSPEGARDYLVPSRVHPGMFYALPQAPQQFKQLLMVAGFDRYFQIAPCFRDEDGRADRSPGEFYQLDFEMSFVTQEDVWATIEPILAGVFEEFGDGRAVTAPPFPRIPYDEAMAKYGTDKPDLRNPIVVEAVSDHFRDSGFKVFANILANDPKAEVWAIPAKTGGSRAFCDRMNSWAQGEGQPGLGYIFWRKEGDKLEGAGPIAKNIGEERTEALRRQLGLADGDAAFFVAGDPKKFVNFAGAARTRAGEELNLVDRDRFELCWIVDFPFFEWNEDEKKIDFAHNPFSMPQGGIDALTNQEPLSIKAFQYDAVCNGYEIASGGIRNHLPETMVKAFEMAGLDRRTVEERFGGLYRAFQYGAPPHGGAAFGIDRVVMLLVGAKNLREITMFPMNQQAYDLLMNAPSEATPQQLRELSLRVAVAKKEG